MLNSKSELNQNRSNETQDFSLVLGGPLYQLLRRSHLTDNAFELVYRRIIAFVVITWLPLLILTTIEGLAWNGRKVPFLYDIDRGRVATGMDADLVGLASDPAKDVKSFSNVRYTIRAGHIIYRAN